VLPPRAPAAAPAPGSLTAIIPPAAPRPTAAPPARAAVAANGAKGGGTSSALVIGGGLAGLAALGVGAYFVLAPGSKPAPTPPPPSVQAQAPEAPPVAAVAVAPPSAAAPPVAAPPVAAAPAAFSAVAEFERVVRSQSAGFGVRAEAPKTELRIGRDEFRFSLASDRDGLVYVFGYGADGTLAQLVPNRRSGVVRIRKGQAWRFPAADRFTLLPSDPPGPTHLLLMVSAHPRKLDGLRLEDAGDVKLYPAQATLEGLAAAHAGTTSVLVGSAACPAGTACDDEYGAAVLRFDTVK
jgi:hypothetical protein